MKAVVWIAVLFAFNATSSFAAEEMTAGELKATYCGSGFTSFLVLDEFAGCRFTEACKAHDICYGRCDPDGDLHGSEYCALPEASTPRTESKTQCDAKLAADIVAQNSGSHLCSVLAGIYRFAVKNGGQGPFNGRKASELYVKVAAASLSADDAERKLDAIAQLARAEVIDIAQVNLENNKLVLPTRVPVSAPLSNNPRVIVLPAQVSKEQLLEIGKTRGR